MILGEDPWLNTSTSCTYPEPWETRGHVQEAEVVSPFVWNISRPRDHYHGTYSHMGFGNITVDSVDNDLVLMYGRFGKILLQPIYEEEFIGIYVGMLWFVTNSDGNVVMLPIDFIFNDKQVNALLFPVDLRGNRTLFVKGGNWEPARNVSTDLVTSPHCTAGSSVVSLSPIIVFWIINHLICF